MTITVRLFALVRERAGTPQVMLELPAGSTVADAATALAERFACVADLLPRAAIAVNRQYAPATTLLHDGDELAVIPPVSGG